MHSNRLAAAWAALLLLASGCAGILDGSADRVFLGEHILTMDPERPHAEAVAIRGDTIVAVGSREEVAPFLAERTERVELGERALLPGFIDTHGHLALVIATLDMVNVSSPPVGPVETMADLQGALARRIRERDVAAGEWVTGYGYDDSLIAEDRHPSRDDLDAVSSEHPIALLHVSGHLAALNSRALAEIGFDAETADPPGGVIRRRPGSSEPNGVLEETAAHAAMQQLMGDDARENFTANLEKAIAYHAGFGITTIQDGASPPELVSGLRLLTLFRSLPVDVVAFPHAQEMPLDASLDDIGYSREYRGGFRVGGVKFVIDGSPQGRTAWLTEPYVEGPPGADPDYRAYTLIEPEDYKPRAARMLNAGIPILVHTNGDAAIDLLIESVDEALGDTPKDHRSVAIHAQLTRPDQIEAMKRAGILPSYFAAHPFFWGDWHRKSFGDARALHTSPLGASQRAGLRFTIHNDAPVVPPDILRLIEIAVTRKTRSGFVLGEEQRISVEDAIRAVTADAAYQYFEEDSKGSLTPGKRADLVILARDPREVPRDEIGEIAVVETVARGRSVHRQDAGVSHAGTQAGW